MPWLERNDLYEMVHVFMETVGLMKGHAKKKHFEVVDQILETYRKV